MKECQMTWYSALPTAIAIKVMVHAFSVMSDSLGTPWTVARQAPCPWDFQGKNTGVGCHSFSRGSS